MEITRKKIHNFFSWLLVIMLCYTISYEITNPAWAITFHNISVNADSISLTYAQSQNDYVTIHTTADAEAVTAIQSTTFSKTNAPLSQDLGTGSYLGIIDCMSSSNRCVVLWDGSTQDRIRVITTTGSTLGTVATTESGSNRLVAGDDMYVSGSSVFIPMVCSGADTDRIVDIYSISGSPTLSGEIGDCAGTNWGANGFNDLQVSGSKLYTATGAVSAQFQIWNTGGGRVCTATIAVDTLLHVGSVTYISTGSGTVQIYDDSCADTGDITAGQHGITGSIRNLDVNSARNELYIVGDTGVAVMNLTDTTQRLYNVPIGDAGASNRHNFVVAGEFEQFANLASNVVQIRELDPTANPTGGTGQVCVDTNLDGVITGVDVCFTDTNGDGVADTGVAGLLDTFRMNENATTLGFKWQCILGIGSCTDENPKTNGVGILYTILIVIFSYMFLVLIHVSAIKMLHKENVQVMQYLTIHPLLLAVMLVLDVGLTKYYNWIPDEIFFTLIVFIAGAGGFGIYKLVKGANE